MCWAPTCLLGHGVWLDDEEIDLVLATRTAIAYCPWAYLRLGQGVTRMGRHAEIVERGGRVALGCDAANAGDVADILRAAALAAGIARDGRLDPQRFGAHQAFELATIAGAEAIGMADRIGSLEVGKQADIVVHDATDWGWSPRGDVGLQLIWGTDGRSVRDVFVAGRRRDPRRPLRHGRRACAAARCSGPTTFAARPGRNHRPPRLATSRCSLTTTVTTPSQEAPARERHPLQQRCHPQCVAPRGPFRRGGIGTCCHHTARPPGSAVAHAIGGRPRRA